MRDEAEGEVRVRAAGPADLEPVTDIYNHYVVHSAATFDLVPFSYEDRREWMSHYREAGPRRLLVADQRGRVVGYATSSRLRPKGAYERSVETSVYLAPSAVGQRVGAALYSALFAALAQEPVHRAYAGVTLPNPASVALHRRFGFEQLGLYHEVGRKFDRYWSVQWFEKRLDPR